MRIFTAKRFNICVRIALAISLGIIFLQASYIRRLQTDTESLAARGSLGQGLQVPNIDALDSSGRRAIVCCGATSRPTIVYVFRPGCSWCERNDKAVNLFAGQVSNRYRIIGLSLSDDGLTDFLKAHPVTFPVYHGLSPSLIASLNLGTTPETIAVSPTGRVLASWNGVYLGATQRGIERFFSISLANAPVVGSGS
jgi:hypothetical protein